MKKVSLLMLVLALIFSASIIAASQNGKTPPTVSVDGSSGHHGVSTTRTGLNLGRQTVIDSIPAPGSAHMGLAWDGTYLWSVSNASTPIVVYQIDPQTGTVVNTVTTGINSYVLGCTYLNGSLWIQEWFSYGYTYEVDPATGSILSYFSSPAGINSRGLTNDGTHLWIMDAPSAIAYQVTTAGSVVRSVSMAGTVLWAMDATWNFQRGTLFLVDNDVANDIKELDVSGSTAILLDEFAHPGAVDIPEGITYDGQYLWTTAYYANWIWQIDIGDPAPGTAWDFETGWQGWTNTNGLPFPGGWEPYDAAWRSGMGYQCPSSGDSSMFIDSDEYFAATADTALSPLLAPSSGMDWLRYGYLYLDIGGGDYFEVGIKYFDGATWSVAPLRTYNTSNYGAWDSVDVSGYTGYPLIQVYFYYYAAGWDWFAAFDNVFIGASIAENDVGCSQVTSPPEGALVPAGDYDVIGSIKNFGDFTETFDVTANVYDTTNAWTVIFNQTLTLTDFAPGADSSVTFGSVTFEQATTYYTEIYTELVGDENPDNDTCTTFSSTPMFDVLWNFETGLQGWTHTNGQAFPAGWAVMPSGYRPAYTPPSAGDSTMWIDSDQAGYVTLYDTAYSPTIVPSPSTQLLKYGIGFLWYSAGNSEWVEVGVRAFTSGAWQTPVGLKSYYNTFGPAWDSVDVSAYQSADSLKIFFSYNYAYYEWYVAFDNVMINVQTGISEEPGSGSVAVFGFAPGMSTVHRNHVPIAYTTTTPSHVTLKVYDNMGRLVRTLVDAQQPAGEKSVPWDNKDLNKRTVANGVYFLKLEAEGNTAVQKLVLVR